MEQLCAGDLLNPLRDHLLITFHGNGGWDVVDRLSVMSDSQLEQFMDAIYSDWQPEGVEDPEADSMIQEAAAQRRRLFKERLALFRSHSLRAQQPDVCCPYCSKIPNRQALDDMVNNPNSQQRWLDRHVKDAHFCCGLCEKEEDERVRLASSYKRSQEHRFSSLGDHVNHVEKCHKGKHALW